jgi:hypothetical protein
MPKTMTEMQSLETQKFCECGCGQPTRLAPQTDKRHGMIAGQPVRWLKGHHFRGAGNHGWKGGRIDSGSYTKVLQPNHPNANAKGYVYEHVLVASEALGKAIPPKAVIHHVNGDSHDNRPANLVVCENQEYHGLLHVRTRALEACGNANWLKCKLCKQWDDTKNLTVSGKGNTRTIYHKACVNARTRR